MKYYIAVEEMRSTVIEIEADSADEAMSKVEKAYNDDVVCLNSTDYIDDGACFRDETNEWKPCIESGYEAHFQKILGE